MNSGQESLWRFQPRESGRVSVCLDNNIWDWLYAHRVTLRLSEELPSERFALLIPREVEIEHLAIPADSHDKLEKRSFIAETIHCCGIKTIGFFGFAAPSGIVNRFLGFDHGTWMSDLERARIEAMRPYLKRGTRPSGLAGNEADLMVALSAFHSVVLTRDQKSGPLQFARERGGKILFVSDGHAVSGTLAAAILEALGAATVGAKAFS